MPVPLKGDRMFSRSIFKMFLFVTILAAIVSTATAAAPANEEAQSSIGSIHTYLMPDLSLKSVFAVPVLPSGAAFRKTCRCSCGSGHCATDADCGGAPEAALRSSVAAPREMQRCRSPVQVSLPARLSCLHSREAVTSKDFLKICAPAER
jgi:hypothetical protein